MSPHPSLTRMLTCLLSAGVLLLAVSGPAVAQLGDTPWPMYQHDLRHTGQSEYLGPLFSSGAPAPENIKMWHGSDRIMVSPVLSADGSTLYTALGFSICAIDTATMSTNWCQQLRYMNRLGSPSNATPAIGADGTIYLGDRENNLTAFNPADGSRKWTYNHGFEGDIWTSPAIAPAGLPAVGTIYFAHDQSLDGTGVVTALNPNGSLKWKYVIGTLVRESSPAIDKNGIIYIGDLKGVVHAFQDNGPNNVVRLWKKQIGALPGITASPVISKDSKTLYIGSTAGLTALDMTNSPLEPPILWTFPTTGRVAQTPALATDGTLYVPALNGSAKTIYAVNPDGSLKWKFGPLNSGSETSAHIAIGADGVVYAGMNYGVYALSPLGTVLWQYQTNLYIHATPAISGTATPLAGGTAVLYLAGRNWNIYAISSPRTGLATNHPPTANAGPDQSVSVGQLVTFDGSGSSDLDNDSLTYAWDFGDGTQGSGVSPTHTYFEPSPPGGYTATLTVSDGLASGTDSVKITVTGPSITSFLDTFNRTDSDTLGGPSPSGPQWGEAQGNLLISGGQLKNTLRGYNIAILPDLFAVDQAAEADFTSADAGADPRLGVVLRYQDVKNYYLVYRVAGGVRALRISKFVNGIETVLASMPIAQPVNGSPFHLKGRVTGTNLTLELDGVQKLSVSDATFASGTVGVVLYTGPAASHAADNFCAVFGTGPCSPGNPPTNHPPIADAGPDQSASVGQVVTFDGSGSSDLDNDPLTYTWDFGDGTSGSGVNPTHIYLNPSPPGGYIATLSVSDGLASSTDSVTITVTGSPISGFEDNFNRTDSDTLGGPTPSGPQWAEVQGNLSISGGQLKNTLRGYNTAILPDLSGVDQTAAADFTSADAGASPRLGVVLRYQNPQNYYLIHRSAGGTTALRISKFVNGIETVLAQTPIAQPVNGTPFRLGGRVAGTTLTLSLNGVQKLSVSDATFASGNVGVLLYTGPIASHAADNFCATIGTGTCP